MAVKKTNSKKTTGAKSTGRSGSGSKKPAAKTSTRSAKPVEEEVAESTRGGAFWGIFLLALGIFMIISYFSTEGKFVAFFADLVKGLVGWGFWLTVPVFRATDPSIMSVSPAARYKTKNGREKAVQNSKATLHRMRVPVMRLAVPALVRMFNLRYPLFRQALTKSNGISILTAVSSADSPFSMKRRMTASSFSPTSIMCLSGS